MSQSNAHCAPSDELLVAYLDGELDGEQRRMIEAQIRDEAAVAARLSQLKEGDLPFRSAFDELLREAPNDRLQAMLKSLPDMRKPGISRRGFLATAASFIVAGVVADRLFMAWHDAEGEDGWRISVAEYMVLYTPQTLDNLSTDPNSHAAQLSAVGSQLGIPLTTESVSLPGAQFRRAQILDYEGVLIGQLTYLDPRHGPLALCITGKRPGRAALSTEQRLGLNVVYWSTPSNAFMLIGKNPYEDLEIMARSAQKTLLS